MVKSPKILKDRYEIKKLLGQGATSMVYLAQDLKENRLVAVKQLQSTTMESMEKLKSRFVREYYFLSKIKDMNIVRAYDYFHISESTPQIDIHFFFLVLEYVPGVLLSEYIPQISNTPLRVKLAMASQMIRPIEVLNAMGILHRDIKPSNIMVCEKTRLIKLLDLGIAKSLGQGSNLTQTGVAMGTPSYMSPEQTEGDCTISSDVFSLGVVLYQFFAGLKESPFQRQTAMATMKAICSESLLPLVNRLDGFTSGHEKKAYIEMSHILHKAMAKKPENRLQSATELSQLLQKVYKSLEENKTTAKWNVRQSLSNEDARGLNKLASQSPQTVNNNELADNSLFAHYKILKKIGEGGMGCVYKALDTRNNKIVALKILFTYLVEQESYKERFLQEVRMTKMLSHPNIVKLFDSGKFNNILYFTMQWVDGVTLLEYVEQKQPDIGHCVALVRKILMAIEHAHSKGIVHRDLKPSNIMISKDNKVFIMDFGLAKTLSYSQRLTVTGTVIGTPLYMSPEQASGSKNIGIQSDIYSLGTILYEMITGQRPFNAPTALLLLQRVIKAPPKAPSKLNPKIPANLDKICMKSLLKQPRNRYATAAKMAEDLASFASGKALRSTSRTAKTRLQKNRPKANTNSNSIWLIVCGVVVIVALLGWGIVATSSPSWKEEYREAQDYLEQQRFVASYRLHFLLLNQYPEETLLLTGFVETLRLWSAKELGDKNTKALSEISLKIDQAFTQFMLPEYLKSELEELQRKIKAKMISIAKEQQKKQEQQKEPQPEKEETLTTPPDFEVTLKRFQREILRQPPPVRWELCGNFILRYQNAPPALMEQVKKMRMEIEEQTVVACQGWLLALQQKKLHSIPIPLGGWLIIAQKMTRENTRLQKIVAQIDSILQENKKVVEDVKVQEVSPKKNVQEIATQWYKFKDEQLFSLLRKRRFDDIMTRLEYFVDDLENSELRSEINVFLREVQEIEQAIHNIRKNTKLGSTIAVSLTNKKYIRGRVVAIDEDKLVLKDYKKRTHDIAFNEIKARSLSKVTSLKPEGLVIFLIADGEWKQAKQLLKKVPQQRQEVYQKIIASKIQDSETSISKGVKILAPKNFTKKGRYLIEVPNRVWKITLKGKVDRKITQLIIQKKEVTWDTERNFSCVVELQWGMNDIRLQAKDEKGESFFRNWRVKRAASKNETTHRGSWARTGVYVTQGLPKLRGLKWKFKTSGYVTGSPMISGNVLYIVNGKSFLVALNKFTGEKIWDFELSKDSSSRITISDGVVYAGAADRRLYAVDAKTGTEIWSFRTKRGIHGAPVVHNNIVYVGSDRLYAVRAKDGKELWTFEKSQRIIGSPAMANNRLFVAASDNNRVFCVELGRPKEVWTAKFAEWKSPGCAVQRNVVYFGDVKGILYAVDVHKGKEIWQYEAGGGISTTPAIHNKTVYFGSRSHDLYAVNAANGRLRWSFSTRGIVRSSPSIVDDIIYFGSDDNHLYAVTERGKEAWKFETKGEVVGAPLIEDGVVYFASYDKYVYALH
ncbi:protein kinase domain-containing protein [Candidatus Uabimicrobium amorphum]|uniref:non-specific serine/threonine protein kinase n=1 Tax=Uabimicrobium amorphum TaxID=2596890 RepID=A0A5S9IN47_UABAM|nr:serine/threonine-protein kinase [Candidatus Uabimicrobium amorphum]BBM84774.1 protein kinase [Candidatus Uabimicrobium amorphum]